MEGKVEYDSRITLYRGLGLPEKAIEGYYTYLNSKKRFQFTGFTSTSCEEKKALVFAYQAKLKGLEPVLFVMDTEHDDGMFKAFLHDKESSAFPEEKEYLIGPKEWIVTEIKPKVRKKIKNVEFKVTEVMLKNVDF